MMEKSIAHVAPWKKEKLEQIKSLISKYPTIALVDMRGISADQLQKIKFKLKNEVLFSMTKLRIFKKALNSEPQKGISKLSDHIHGTIPFLLLTQLDPFKLSKLLLKNKTIGYAKAGQISPMDITIPEGPTPFAPGQIMGELGAVGIKTIVEKGKLVIKSPVTLVKKGQVINDKIAGILSKLDIKPIEIKLNLVAAYEKGMIYSKDALSISEEEYIEKLKLFNSYALNLAIKISYPTKKTIKILLAKANNSYLALSKKLDIKVEEKPKEEIKEVPQKEEPKEEIKKEPKQKVEEQETSEQEFKPKEFKEEIKLEQKTETPQEQKVEEKPLTKNIKEENLEEYTPLNDEKYQEYTEKAQDILKDLQDQKLKKGDLKRPEPKPKRKPGPTAEELLGG
jgi:large subunit ribosomal protein L10